MCPICYNEKPINYTTPCGHSFHRRCLLEWWNVQYTTQGEISCPICKYQLSDDEIEHSRLCFLSKTWIKKMSLGEDKVRAWIEKVKRATQTTPMKNVLDAPEFVPQT